MKRHDDVFYLTQGGMKKVFVEKCEPCSGAGFAWERVAPLNTNSMASGVTMRRTEVKCRWCKGRGYNRVKIERWRRRS